MHIRRLQSYASWGSSFVLTAAGDPEAGIEAGQQALQLSPDPVNTALARGFLGYAQLEKGNLA